MTADDKKKAEDKAEAAAAVRRLSEQKRALLDAAGARLTGEEFKTLYFALDQVNRHYGQPTFGQLWPGLETLAAKTNSNPRSTRRYMVAVVAGGFLVPVRKGGGRSRDGEGLA